MTPTLRNAVLDALTDVFGDNAGFALELYAQFRADPSSVAESWRTTFERFEAEARVGAEAVPAPAAAAPAPAAAPAAPAA
ncbi:MAG: hypothetical protein EDX89_14830, partial [Acidobacteria bacterium]